MPSGIWEYSRYYFVEGSPNPLSSKEVRIRPLFLFVKFNCCSGVHIILYRVRIHASRNLAATASSARTLSHIPPTVPLPLPQCPTLTLAPTSPRGGGVRVSVSLCLLVCAVVLVLCWLLLHFYSQAFSRLNSRVKDMEERVTTNAAPALENRIKVAEEMWSGEVSCWLVRLELAWSMA